MTPNKNVEKKNVFSISEVARFVLKVAFQNLSPAVGGFVYFIFEIIFFPKSSVMADLKVTVEPPLENQIVEVTYDGQEITQQPMTQGEHLMHQVKLKKKKHWRSKLIIFFHRPKN